MAGEPIKLIAREHAVSETTVIRTVTKYAPSLLGRTRGGGTREWPT
jgi:hypothetical protein